MTAVVMLIATVGALIPLAINIQAHKSRSDALATLDRPEQRIVTVTDSTFGQGTTFLDASTVSQVRELSIVNRLTVLGTLQDTKPLTGWPGSERIPTVDVLSIDDRSDDPCGSVRLPQALTESHRTLHLAIEPAFIAVAGKRQTESHPFADPVVATRNVCDWSAAQQLLILVDESASVEPLIHFVASFGGINLTVSVPDSLEGLRQEVAAGLSDSARQLRNLAMLGTGFLVAATTFITNMTQTRHMARRRALGATRSDIAILILAQVAMLASAGVLVAISAVAAGALGWSYPLDGTLVAAVAITIILVSVVASIPLALIAANRDPAKVLRVP